MILLVRHAEAGEKADWAGDDRLRPLSALGRAQAAALVGSLARYAPKRVVSSPLRRCVETVEPLALELGLDLEVSEPLGPDASPEAAALLVELSGEVGPVVVCTHGETIAFLERALPRDGDGIFCTPTAKGAFWELGLEGGRLRRAEYVSQPELANR